MKWEGLTMRYSSRPRNEYRIEPIERRLLLAVQLVNGLFDGSPRSSNVDSLTNINGTVFFTATGAADGVALGNELWKSNNTAAGTVLVKDIYPGGAGSSPAL